MTTNVTALESGAHLSTAGVKASPEVVSGYARFHTLLAIVVLVLSSITAVMCRRTDVSIEGFPVERVLVQCALIGFVAIYCRWCGHVKLTEGCLLVAWACLLAAILPVPCYFVARDAMPLRDGFLAKMDAILGVNVGAMVVWVRSHPSLNVFAKDCYGLMFSLVGMAAMIPALAGRISTARVFILSTITGVVAVNLCFALFPAVGPWSVYGFQPYPNQELYVAHLEALRTAGRFVMNPIYDTGLITFPSFHVALSIMATRALWWVRWMRPLTGTVCVLIAFSTMATGWHYASDVVGGVALAFVCGRLAERTLKAIHSS
jgi:membrane-associated phospholipid phosphatase